MAAPPPFQNIFFSSSAPCEALRALDYYLQIDSVRIRHNLFPSLRRELIRCIAVSHRDSSLYRDEECKQPRPIQAFRNPQTSSLLILSIIHEFRAITMSSGEQKEQKASLDANEGILILVLAATQALFECRTALPERSFELILEYGKKTLKRTQTIAKTRLVILDPRIDMT